MLVVVVWLFVAAALYAVVGVFSVDCPSFDMPTYLPGYDLAYSYMPSDNSRPEIRIHVSDPGRRLIMRHFHAFI